jgi:CheY-like chemotaxis protein
MTTIVQVEFRPSLLSIRDEILRSLGHPVVSALSSQAARNLALSDASVGVVVIGHGAPREERLELIAHFRKTLPGVPIVALLRRRDKAFDCSDFICSADNPPLRVRTVNQALTGVRRCSSSA